VLGGEGGVDGVEDEDWVTCGDDEILRDSVRTSPRVFIASFVYAS
jgi:hypothetical protein